MAYNCLCIPLKLQMMTAERFSGVKSFERITGLFLAIVMLAGSLTVAQREYVRNFQVVNKTSTHFIVSWDIVDGNYSESNISSFRLYYSQGSSFSSSRYIYYRYTYQSNSTNGVTFFYTFSLQSFTNVEYIMYIRVYRVYPLNPRYTYSNRRFVDLGTGTGDALNVKPLILEISIHLWPSQTCSEMDFFGTSTSTHTQVRQELYWSLIRGCHCSLPYELQFNQYSSYFTCPASGYIIYRATLDFTQMANSSYAPSALLDSLDTWLHGEERSRGITVNGGRYIIGPGPCGVTVPDLYAPHCASTATPTYQMSNAVIVSSMYAAMFFITAGLIGFTCLCTRKNKSAGSGSGR